MSNFFSGTQFPNEFNKYDDLAINSPKNIIERELVHLPSLSNTSAEEDENEMACAEIDTDFQDIKKECLEHTDKMGHAVGKHKV